MPPRVIILADGPGLRWSLPTPKHLAIVDGEPILLRTVRQLVKRKMSDVWLTSRMDRYDALRPFVQRYVPIDNRFQLDQFYACREIWTGLSDVIFLYGDVRFSDVAVDTILASAPRDFAYFQRTSGSVITGKRWKEGFAMRVCDTPTFENALKCLRVEQENGRFVTEPHQVQGYLEGRGMGSFHGSGPHCVEIDDETDDFDSPEEVRLWTQNVTRWRTRRGKKNHGPKVNYQTRRLMPTIKPGEVFFDKLPDGTYEKCVLQMTTESTPNRHAAARGGTGEFYRAIPVEEQTPERIENADEMIFDVSEDDGSGIPKMVLLERINRS